MPWQMPGAMDPIILSSMMKVNVLCKRHNSALSELDTRITHLFQTLRGVHSALEQRSSTMCEFSVFSGEDLERWVLKVLCGTAAGGVLSRDGERMGKRNVPSEWLDLLYTDKPWPPGCGLYFDTGSGVVFEAESRFSFGPLYVDENDLLVGAAIWLAGMPFYLLLHEIDPRPGWIHRPGCLVFRDGGLEKAVALTWAEASSDLVVLMARQPGPAT